MNKNWNELLTQDHDSSQRVLAATEAALAPDTRERRLLDFD